MLGKNGNNMPIKGNKMVSKNKYLDLQSIHQGRMPSQTFSSNLIRIKLYFSVFTDEISLPLWLHGISHLKTNIYIFKHILTITQLSSQMKRLISEFSPELSPSSETDVVSESSSSELDASCSCSSTSMSTAALSLFSRSR